MPLCWWCLQEVDACSRVDYPVDEGGLHSTREGCFCCAACCLAHLQRHRERRMVDLFAREQADLGLQGLQAAPDRELLREFGGPFSLERFHALQRPWITLVRAAPRGQVRLGCPLCCRGLRGEGKAKTLLTDRVVTRLQRLPDRDSRWTRPAAGRPRPAGGSGVHRRPGE